MGLFDKMKSMKNALTGGAAKVYLDAEPLSFDQPFKFTIRAETEDQELKIDRVYLQIRGVEKIEVEDYDYDDGQRRRETIRKSENTIELDHTVSGPQELQANQSYKWEIDVQLPPNALNVYKGHNCEHSYIAYAGLDCFGNDPDSGWINLH